MILTRGIAMSKRTLDIPGISQDGALWVALLRETKDEIRESPDLTDEEKRHLDEIDGLPDGERPTGTCSGRPISETIIDDRGER